MIEHGNRGRDGILPSEKGGTACRCPESGGTAFCRPDSAGNMPALPTRRHPAHGVHISSDSPTIVFLTVCTKTRKPWLACPEVQTALVDVWKVADAWSVGYYMLMPDHLHLFCSPRNLEFSLKQWVSHWKRKFSCLHLPEAGAWQRDYWDTRLRRGETYHDKWEYVQQNPVRKGLTKQSQDWPYQGVLNELRW